MIKKSLVMIFIHCLIIIICSKLFLYSQMQYNLRKKYYNYSVSSQIILPNTVEYTDYLVAYPYYDNETVNIIVNEENTSYQVKIVPYYPEQLEYQKELVYLSSKLKNIPNIKSIQLLETTYFKIAFVENEYESIAYVPYQNLNFSQSTCYFIDLESFDLTSFPHLQYLDINKINQIRQNRDQVLDSKQTTLFFQGVIVIIGVIISLFITYQMVLTTKPLNIILRVFGLTVRKILMVQLLVFSICFILLMALFNLLRIEMIYILIGKNFLYLLVNVLLLNRQTVASLLRKNKRQGD